MSAHPLLDRFEALTPALRRWGRPVFLVVVVGALVWQLSDIGWGSVLGSLPTNPFFYLLFVGLYLTLPLSEVLIYAAIWPIRPRDLLVSMLKKRVVNKDVVGYGGELYLILWVSRLLGRGKREITGVVKDNAVLSFAAITAWTIGLLCYLLYTGRLDRLTGGEIRGSGALVAIVPLLLFGIVVIFRRFRHAVFSMPARLLAWSGGIHLARVVSVAVIQLVQWSVVIPSVSLNTWLTFLAVQIVVTRLPIVPSRDLIFAGVGIQLTGTLGIPVEPLAAMLLVSSVLDKGFNLLLFTLLSVREPVAAGSDGGGTAAEGPGGPESDGGNTAAEESGGAESDDGRAAAEGSGGRISGK